MPVLTNLEAVRTALAEELERDERVILIGEDIGVHGGVFRATDGLQARFGTDRVIDTPLAELALAGVAIGAAMTGLLPVAEIQFADYIHPAFDQLVNEAAKIRYRSGGDWGCPLVVRAPTGAVYPGGLYHSQSVEAYYAHVSGLKVVLPSTPYDMKGLLKAAIRDPDPVVFFEHKKTYRTIKGEVPDEDYVVPIGVADVKRAGSDVSVITYGLMVHHALDAAQQLAAEGVSVEVLDLRTLLPLDRDAILATARKTGKVLLLTEDTLTGSMTGELAAIIADGAFESLDAPIRRLCTPDVGGIPCNVPQFEWLIPSVEQVVAALRELAAY
ncbi:MAG: alpha-ketoacid dehydrogenase subunit beta [Roseiflexaceae bacterium]